MPGDNLLFNRDTLKILVAEQGKRFDLVLKIVEIVGQNHNHGPGHIEKEPIGLSCRVCGKEFDHYKAGCPRCMKLERQRYNEIDLRNKHLESLGGVFIGEDVI